MDSKISVVYNYNECPTCHRVMLISIDKDLVNYICAYGHI